MTGNAKRYAIRARSRFDQRNSDLLRRLLLPRDLRLAHKTLLDQSQPILILHTQRRSRILHLERKETIETISKNLHRDRGLRLQSDSDLTIDRERMCWELS